VNFVRIGGGVWHCRSVPCLTLARACLAVTVKIIRRKGMPTQAWDMAPQCPQTPTLKTPGRPNLRRPWRVALVTPLGVPCLTLA